MYGRELARAVGEGQRQLGIRGGLDHAIHIAAQLGYDRRWIREQLENAPHIVARIRHEYMNANEQGVQGLLDDLRAAHNHAATWWRDNVNRPIERLHRETVMNRGNREPEQASLSNSPAEEQEETKEEEPMAKRNRTEDGAHDTGEDPAQTGLDSLQASGPIWTHFTNTQRTRLHWRETIYMGDESNFTAGKIPFQRGNIVTTTTLSNTGGGATTTGTTQAMGTADGSVYGYDFETPYLLQIRMTSPYNILKSLGDTSKSTYTEPNWVSLWDGIYQYYQVKETDWGITFHFGDPRLTAGGQTGIAGNPQAHKLRIFWRYTNQDDPPTKWTYSTNRMAVAGAWDDNTTSSGQLSVDKATTIQVTTANQTVNLTSDDYDRMGGWNSKLVSFSTTHSTTVHIGGKYRFGQCKMDIKTLMTTDSHGAQTNPTAEGMAIVRTTPQFPEILSVIIVNEAGSTLVPGITVPCTLQMDTSQQIDFCDLKANVKFPTPNLSNQQGTAMYTTEQYFRRDAFNQ